MDYESLESLLLSEQWKKASHLGHFARRCCVVVIVTTTLLGLGTAFIILLVVTKERTCLGQLKRPQSWSPAEPAVASLSSQFEGSFLSHSIYKGKPSPLLDGAWDNVTHLKYIPLSEEEVRRLGKDPRNTVQFPPDFRIEDKPYAGFLEVFHQLHCLNTIRQYLDIDHYKVHFPGTELENRAHVDHCIDILRQVLMCQADISVVTMNWVTFMEHPTPDFSTNHICRDFQRIQRWNDDHALPWAPFRKTSESVELDHYPKRS